ncbi:PF04327 family protein [Leptospira fainei serovar Hurstbridge str. BUT 6]|uniref:Ribosomal processing cysteine protease Prp n=1 Tax=Leptospira fainei serovar Hurstbridge str. BUT 6 TaxID=1193011 RepID=S3USM6_9LEPT|nr:ribosomal-processing cysteine protease Prp [Leptospira fainei]EPG73406.1 PF04327 family protein [Leptospira fainei serovar Hurstbridge str. BUT 6]
MIRVKILRKGEEILGFESVGHASAEQGTKGSNLLCAAVGVLIQSLYLHLRKEGKAGPAEVRDGFLKFKILAGLENDPVVRTSFALVRDGLENLRDQYSSEIELIGE